VLWGGGRRKKKLAAETGPAGHGLEVEARRSVSLASTSGGGTELERRGPRAWGKGEEQVAGVGGATNARWKELDRERESRKEARPRGEMRGSLANGG
jgi:hypothetical protein